RSQYAACAIRPSRLGDRVRLRAGQTHDAARLARARRWHPDRAKSRAMIDSTARAEIAFSRGKPVPTPHQVRGRPFPENALSPNLEPRGADRVDIHSIWDRPYGARRRR